MSTRSSIAIKRKDGSIESIYCHSNGFLEHNGYLLNYYYKDINKINNLINLGDISCLNKKVNPDPSIPHSFEYKNRQKDVVVAYGRDRGETNTEKNIFQNIDDYKISLKDSWQVYSYLYDEENKKWLWSSIPYEDTDSMEFLPLNEKLEELGCSVIRDSNLESVIKKQIEFEKNLNIIEFNKIYESDEDAYFSIEEKLSDLQGLKNYIDMDSCEMNRIATCEDLNDKETKKLYNQAQDIVEILNELKNKREKVVKVEFQI